ncbi:MAG TPA: 2-hydroxyacid dehydrogenase [Caulobacteraceae bacterium]|nr:2-hydroxyacid dehydrogenase [Caulobacteraceae bacterium]
MTKPVLLQLCPFSPALEQELNQTFEVCRLFELTDSDGWLKDHGATVQAIATGGHIGAPNALIERLPGLGIVAINGVGFDKVDLDLARSRGIRVTTTPQVLTEDVADMAVGLIIALLRGVVPADGHVRSGAWLEGERPLARKVSGRRFGVVGLGQIGGAIAARLSPFGPVAYTDLAEKPGPYRFAPNLLALAESSDVLILASSANASTRHLVNDAVLRALGPEGYLVNVARGSLVDEDALTAALAQGRIAGAALDVFADEPRVPEALIAAPGTVLTPHIGSATVETRQAMADLVIANLRAFIAGAPLPSALV